MPIEVLESADPKGLAAFDMVIDVRTPAEFAEDHAPGAVNLPVLSNAQRAKVGRIYVRDSRFRARRIGAAHIARNVARHLERALADQPGSFRPLIYCWRGGMRSHAMATIFSEVGWRTTVLAGGYHNWRRYVTGRLYDDSDLALRFVLIDGSTGVAKTEVLKRLAARGAQTIDLEDLAAHRGSLFGGLAERAQPSQKMFESRLLALADAMDPARPVFLEAESSKIGQRMLPPALWRPMTQAPRIELLAAPEARARYLVTAYADIVADRARLDEALRRLPRPPGPKRLADWAALAQAGRFEDLALMLVERHYDPAYRRSRRKGARAKLGEIEMGSLAPADIDRAADEVLRLAG